MGSPFMTSLIATPFLDDGPFQVPPPTKNQIMMGLENVACPLFLVSDLSNVSSSTPPQMFLVDLQTQKI